MVAVYGNLMVMGIAVALFIATVNLGRRPPVRRPAEPEASGPHPEPQPRS